MTHPYQRNITTRRTRIPAPQVAYPSPDSSPEPGNLTLAPMRQQTTTVLPSVSTLNSSVPHEVRENTFFISVSAFYDEPSLYPCILECYSAAAVLHSPGVVVKYNNRHSLLKQWLGHIFTADPDCPRVILVDTFLGQLVGEMYNDQEFASVLTSRKLKLVHLNPVVSLNNSLNIPFEIADKAFKENIAIHSSHDLRHVDYMAHTECCYKKAALKGFTPATMQRGWAFTDLEKVWKKADLVGLGATESRQGIEEEKARIQHAWTAIAKARTLVDEREQNLMSKYQQKQVNRAPSPLRNIVN